MIRTALIASAVVGTLTTVAFLPTPQLIDAKPLQLGSPALAEEVEAKPTELEAAAELLAPLLDEIAKAEGGPQAYNAVNRGYAGDTPGGARSVLGRDLTDMTIAEVIEAQRWRVYAVGAFQFIPKTLRTLVHRSRIDPQQRFTAETQQKLAVLLIKHHRPDVWRYITGKGGSQYGAALEMAKEWASLGHPADDRSFYAGVGGNAAKVRSGFVIQVLNETRGNLDDHLEL